MKYFSLALGLALFWSGSPVATAKHQFELRGMATTGGAFDEQFHRQTESNNVGTVTAFRVYDADKNELLGSPLNSIAAGSSTVTIDLATLPGVVNLNIVAVTAGNVGSIKFLRDSTAVETENGPTFAYCGNNGRDFLACPDLVVGFDATITARPYKESNARGKVGADATLKLKIVRNGGGPNNPPVRSPVRAPTPTTPSTPTTSGGDAAVALTLVNADTDKGIRPLVDGTTVILAQTPRINVRADIVAANANRPSVESVRFLFNGRQFKTEDNAPFAFNGNSGSDFFPFVPPVGCHTIAAEAFTRDGANGSLVAKVSVNFCVVDNTKAPTIQAPAPIPVTPPVKTGPVAAPLPTPVPTLAPAPVPATAPVPEIYDISFHSGGSTISAFVTYFAASVKWESVITSGLSDRLSNTLPPRFDGCVLPEVIDDLFVCLNDVKVGDGLGGLIALTNADVVDGPTGLPAVGTIFIDAADVGNLKANGQFRNLVFQQMGVVMGFGNLWAEKGAVTGGFANCDYVGQNANREYEIISGCASVPISKAKLEADLDATCQRWEDSCMKNELMTAVVDPGEAPLSRITVGSLEDLGYEVNYASADIFGTGNLAPECVSPQCSFQRRDLAFMKDGSGDSDVSHAGGRRRRMSQEGHAKAVEAGLAYLDKQAERRVLHEDHVAAAASTSNQESQPASIYVGDQMVSVTYQDSDGEIYNVMVHRESKD